MTQSPATKATRTPGELAELRRLRAAFAADRLRHVLAVWNGALLPQAVSRPRPPKKERNRRSPE
jgi:hypothetical protein